jgi:hypothetical protein
MSTTLAVFHRPISPRKAIAPANIETMLVQLAVFHFERSALNAVKRWNSPCMFAMRLVSHSEMGPYVANAAAAIAGTILLV